MNLLNIALLQILPQNTLEENLQKGLEACRQAQKAGADIALFPEMWSTGLCCGNTAKAKSTATHTGTRKNTICLLKKRFMSPLSEAIIENSCIHFHRYFSKVHCSCSFLYFILCCQYKQMILFLRSFQCFFISDTIWGRLLKYTG